MNVILIRKSNVFNELRVKKIENPVEKLGFRGGEIGKSSKSKRENTVFEFEGSEKLKNPMKKINFDQLNFHASKSKKLYLRY